MQYICLYIYIYIYIHIYIYIYMGVLGGWVFICDATLSS